MNPEAIKQAIAAARLTIEPVPDTCTIARVRDHIEPAEWEIIRSRAEQIAGRCCPICGRAAGSTPLECAEVWDFDDDAGRLTLTGLAALCTACFHTKSIGRTSDAGAVKIAVFQLAKVNKWTEELSRFYVNVCFRVWDARSQRDWVMDLSFVRRNFQISIVPKKKSAK